MMKRWAIVVVVLYMALLFFAILPLAATWSLRDTGAGSTGWREFTQFWPKLDPYSKPDAGELLYWAFFIAILLAQTAFLSVPVEKSAGRPVTRRTIIPLVAASGLAMGLLGAGVSLSLTELLTGGTESGWFKASFAVFLLMWVFWAYIFARLGRERSQDDFLARQCRLLFKGSILELLVAVPSHIIARHRDYCCAGMYTFVGIAFGLSVMLLSFGPGVLFLFSARIGRLRGKKSPA
jgi:hypothetical protein